MASWLTRPGQSTLRQRRGAAGCTGAPLPTVLLPRTGPGGPTSPGECPAALGALLQTSPRLSPSSPPTSRPLFTDCCFLPLGTSGRRMGPPWAPRAAPASVSTRTAPCTSRRRGRGTSACTPAGCCPPEAMTLAVPTCVSGKGSPPTPRKGGPRPPTGGLCWRMPGPHVTWVHSPLGTYPSLLQGLPPPAQALCQEQRSLGMALGREKSLQVDGHTAEHEVQAEPWAPVCPLTAGLTGGPTTSLSFRQLPHAPEHPMATLSTAERRAINLTWAKPFDGNSPLLRYVLEMSENSKPPRPGRLGAWTRGVGPGPRLWLPPLPSPVPWSKPSGSPRFSAKGALACASPVVVTVAHDQACEGRDAGPATPEPPGWWRRFCFLSSKTPSCELQN